MSDRESSGPLGGVALHALVRLLLKSVGGDGLDSRLDASSPPQQFKVFERSGAGKRGMYKNCFTATDVLMLLQERVACAGAFEDREGAIITVDTALTSTAFKVDRRSARWRRWPPANRPWNETELGYKALLPYLLGGVSPPQALVAYLERLEKVLAAEGEAKSDLALELALEGWPRDLRCPAKLASWHKLKIQTEPFSELARGFSNHYFLYCLSADYRFRSRATGILLVLLKVLPTILNVEHGPDTIDGLRSPLMWSLGLDLAEVEADEQRTKLIQELQERLLERHLDTTEVSLSRAIRGSGGWATRYNTAVSNAVEAGLKACSLCSQENP